MTSHDLAVVFHWESEEEKCWPPYVMDLCIEELPDKSIVPVDRGELQWDQTMSEINKATVTLLLATPTLVDSLVQDSMGFEEVLCGTVIMADVCNTAANCDDLHRSYKDYKRWQYCSFSDDGSENAKTVEIIKNIVRTSKVKKKSARPIPNVPAEESRNVGRDSPSDEEKTTHKALPQDPANKESSSPRPTPAVRPRSNVSKNKILCVVPDKIHRIGEPVVIVLKQAIPEDHTDSVRVEIEGCQTDVVVKVLNPNTLKFKAPDRPLNDESARVKVFVNNKEILSQKSDIKLTYINPEYTAFHCLQMVHRLFDTDSKEELDKLLCKEFSESCAQDNILDRLAAASSHLETPTKSKAFFPTIMHFAAYHGLEELASCIMSTEYGPKTFLLENRDGHNAGDLADLSGRESLAEYLRCYMATASYVEMIQQPHELYSNLDGMDDYTQIGTKLGGNNKGYIKMTGRSASDDTDPYLTMVGGKREQVPHMTEKEEEELLGHKAHFIPEKKQDRGKINRTQSDLSGLSKKQSTKVCQRPQEGDAPRHTPSEFMGMKGAGKDIKLREPVMGSGALAELEEIRQCAMDGEITEDEAVKLGELWMTHHGQGTKSFKEKQAALVELREKLYVTHENTQTGNRLKKCFQNFTKKNKEAPKRNIDITDPIRMRGNITGITTPTASTNSSIRGSGSSSNRTTDSTTSSVGDTLVYNRGTTPRPRESRERISKRDSLQLPPVPAPPPRARVPMPATRQNTPQLPPKDYRM